VTPAAPGAGRRPGPLAVRAPAAPAAVLPPRACLDCGSPLTGKYCTVCGQKDEPLGRGVADLALEFLHHPLIDTKLWRSLVPLLLHPGLLTEEYLAGRRTRYVRPLKLYLTISVLFFTVLALSVSPDKWVQFQNVADVPSADAGQTKQTLHLPIRWLDERFQRNTSALDGEPTPQREAARHAVASRVATSIPKMVFILLPLAAVVLKLFWWRRYYVEHLIFTLHLHSYAFLAAMVKFLHWTPVTVVVLVWSCVYLVLAFKRVYRDGWAKTLAKLLGVSFSYSIVLALALALTTVTALVAG
jgi:hypothetical protein